MTNLITRFRRIVMGDEAELNIGGADLPEVDVEDDGKVLAVVDGNWQKSDVPYTQTTTLFSGTAEVESI